MSRANLTEGVIMYIEEKLDQLLIKQQELISRVELFLPNIEHEKGVIHFLEITKSTFNKYISEGIFIEGLHFVKAGKKRVFIPEAIIKLKQSGVKGRRKASSKQDKLDAINQHLGIIPEYRSAV